MHAFKELQKLLKVAQYKAECQKPEKLRPNNPQ